MAAPAQNHVWVGTETGILKGINLVKKQAANYTEVSSLDRSQEISVMCYGDPQECEVLLGCRDGTVRVFNTEKSKFTEFHECRGGEGLFRGLGVLDNALVTRVESGLLKNTVPLSNPSLSAVKQKSEFTLMAKRIGKDLSNTFTKLEKLTILAKRKSLFDDKAVEIEELTYIIKQDINSLNQQIAQLQSFVRARGSQSGRHLQTHSNTVVVSLQIGYISVIKIHSGTNLPAGRFGGRTAHAPAILEDGGAQERRRTDLGRP
ncbi:unnamed protein product, partial [Ranitomeya imitator]